MSSSLKTIHPYTYEEVESLLDRFNDAIIGHAKWLAHWNSDIICGIPVAEMRISDHSHHECKFGQWYYHEGSRLLHQMPEFLIIEGLHKTIHVKMSDIVSRSNRREPVTKALCESFLESEANFTMAVVELRDGLYNLLHSFDSLTGTFNRQAFFQILEQEHARIVRLNELCSLILLDIDNFKDINDKFGHLAGDNALISLANFIHTHLRPYDSICRYGGEEFMICMPRTSSEVAHTIIERLRKELCEEKIYLTESMYINIPASFGIAEMTAEEELKVTIDHADKALYQAKENGRNRVEVWVN